MCGVQNGGEAESYREEKIEVQNPFLYFVSARISIVRRGKRTKRVRLCKDLSLFFAWLPRTLAKLIWRRASFSPQPRRARHQNVMLAAVAAAAVTNAWRPSPHTQGFPPMHPIPPPLTFRKEEEEERKTTRKSGKTCFSSSSSCSSYSPCFSAFLLLLRSSGRKEEEGPSFQCRSNSQVHFVPCK